MTGALRGVGVLVGIAVCSLAGCHDRNESTLLNAISKDAARPASPPAPRAQAGDAGAQPGNAADFVDLHELDPSIVIDMRYAGTDNFTGVAVYPVARCLLRRAVAERVVAVQRALQRRDRGLKGWDCYRPVAVQRRFWALVPDARYVARVTTVDGRVVSGSKHNRGAAIDVTLVDSSGAELVMPTGFDEFSRRAQRSYRGSSAAARGNVEELEQAMAEQGFIPLATEWWHFDASGWQRYPIADQPLDR